MGRDEIVNMGNKMLYCKGEQRNGKVAAEGRGVKRLPVLLLGWEKSRMNLW